MISISFPFFPLVNSQVCIDYLQLDSTYVLKNPLQFSLPFFWIRIEWIGIKPIIAKKFIPIVQVIDCAMVLGHARCSILKHHHQGFFFSILWYLKFGKFLHKTIKLTEFVNFSKTHIFDKKKKHNLSEENHWTSPMFNVGWINLLPWYTHLYITR